jgi:phage gp45-like
MLALGELLKERVECGFAHVVVVVVDDDDMRRTRLWSDEIAIRDTDGTRIRIKGL